ncbi:GntR family transcriptional regulator [Streptomyces sp. QL37]|uniref:GntR family transcriptional regulator n=1 Tax=Streptomyces sp. QL37 TaxID=2093747 RepID=UPI000CF292A0|nr:GntR family transcriptional regulator [Streptomyces sp. QL37]PPQ58635.1 transcriptional regulator [Streptomyces sp. QL37]
MAVAYERIADELRQSIRTGEMGPGDRLPAESKLARTYGRSVPTIRDALRLLRDEGLIETHHGRGNFVRRPRAAVLRTNDRHQWEKRRARVPRAERLKTGATEYDTGLRLDDLGFQASYRDVPADGRLSEIFGVPVGEPLLERTYRTRHVVETAPLSLVTSYMVLGLIEKNADLLDESNEPWPGGTQNQLFTVGIELSRIEEHVTARPPTPEEAEELDLPPEASVLILRKTSFDTDDRAVEMSEVTLPGDRTEMLFTTLLERW